MDARKHRRGGRPCRPEQVEAARALVEGTKLSIRLIAARVGMCPDTLRAYRARQGWSRPLAPRAPRRGRSGGHPIAPEVVEAARALVEGSALSEIAIGRRLGVSPATLAQWRRKRRWVRPPEAPRAVPPPRADGRARPTRSRTGQGKPYTADTLAQAETLLRFTLLTQKAIAKRLAVSEGWVGRLLRRRGWARPPAPPGSTRFSRTTRTGPLVTEGDRRGRPYAASVRREARLLWEETRLPTALIGARVGAHPTTIARWARSEGWERPRGRLGARQLRGWFGSLKAQAGVSRGGAAPGAARPRMRLL